MCGVCAGRRGDTQLGDVIVANRVYQSDFGAKTVTYVGGVATETFKGDLTTYQVPAAWRQAIESFQPDPVEAAPWLAARPLSFDHQLDWILEQLHLGVDPI